MTPMEAKTVLRSGFLEANIQRDIDEQSHSPEDSEHLKASVKALRALRVHLREIAKRGRKK